MEKARELEESIDQWHNRSVATKRSRNLFSEMLEKTRALIQADTLSSEGEVNEYALNRTEMTHLLEEATKWYNGAREQHALVERYDQMRLSFQQQFDEAMTRFHEKRLKELEEERRRQEEEDRKRREEERIRREEEERKLREEQKRMVMQWKAINKRSYLLSECITQEEVSFWLNNHNRV
mgnify:CR=1 FL=1